MKRRSAGVLLFRYREAAVEVFLVHPGGPFWARKDLGAWSLPKGEYSEEEDPLAAAKREFAEETGFALDGDRAFLPLGESKQPGGKIVSAWALEHDLDPSLIKSNTFSMEWPPRSGKTREFPEVDAAGWFSFADAMRKLTKGQSDFVTRLATKLADADSAPAGTISAR